VHCPAARWVNSVTWRSKVGKTASMRAKRTAFKATQCSAPQISAARPAASDSPGPGLTTRRGTTEDRCELPAFWLPSAWAEPTSRLLTAAGRLDGLNARHWVTVAALQRGRAGDASFDRLGRAAIQALRPARSQTKPPPRQQMDAVPDRCSHFHHVPATVGL
jgi:hypothetical protein